MAYCTYAKLLIITIYLVGEKIDQIDLISTLSLLLGLPIPFSNLGRVIELFFNVENLSRALKLNAVQVLRYAQEYSQLEINVQVIF